ncbi:MAG TPA: protease complex subunit PrcB family protein [Gemmatimonadales bacterium]|nr:protease complex subunit PrcB family protein [Gemmatimonadales bacterium]
MTARVLSVLAAAALAGCGSGTIRPTDEPEPETPTPSVSPSTTVDPEPAPPTSPVSEAPAAPAPVADTAGGSNPAPGTAVEIRRIGRWTSSGIAGSRRLVIRDSGTWATFWSEMGAGVRPEVDFRSDLVIAVAAGERSTGGHDIEVRNVSRAGDQLRIEVLETYPSSGCTTTQARTQPVDVVMVSAAGVKGWSFIDSRAVGTC